MKNYINVNKDAWELKTAVNVESEFYDNASFLSGKNSLNAIELELLGDLNGKTVLHLQCHFGQDSLSLARLGAHVTAVDFSEKAIAQAQEMNNLLGLNVEFICSNIYDLKKVLDKKFDFVFTSYGVIGWLEDLDKWATIISSYLKPKGCFVMVEFHPVVWMFDDEVKHIVYRYFKDEAIEEVVSGTYADKSAHIEYETITWNHSLAEVLNALIKNKIEIRSFEEYDYSVYNCFNNTVEDNGKYRIKHFGNKIPLMFSLVGIKGLNNSYVGIFY